MSDRISTDQVIERLEGLRFHAMDENRTLEDMLDKVARGEQLASARTPTELLGMVVGLMLDRQTKMIDAIHDLALIVRRLESDE